MKKILSTSLAAAMLLGMSTTSFAAIGDVTEANFILDGTNIELYEYNGTEGMYLPVSFATANSETDGLQPTGYGDDYGVLVNLDGMEDRDIDRLRAYANWDLGEDTIVELELEKAKYGDLQTVSYTYTYAVLAETNNTGGGTPAAPVAAKYVKADSTTATPTYTDNVDLAKKVTATTDADFSATAAGTDVTGTELVGTSVANKEAVSEGYQYMIKFNTEDSTTTSIADIAGKITIATSKSKADDNFDLIGGAGEAYVVIGGEASNSGTTWYPHGKVPDTVENIGGEFEGDLEDLEFFGGDVIFTVDTANQSTRLNLATSASFNSEFAAMYPYANLDFYKFSAEPSFNRTGELTFYVDASDSVPYIYEVTEDGAVETNAVYDEDYEAYVLKTRTLGNYVISDVELVAAETEEPTVEEPTVDEPTTEAPTTEVKPNPSTGR